MLRIKSNKKEKKPPKSIGKFLSPKPLYGGGLIS